MFTTLFHDHFATDSNSDPLVGAWASDTGTYGNIQVSSGWAESDAAAIAGSQLSAQYWTGNGPVSGNISITIGNILANNSLPAIFGGQIGVIYLASSKHVGAGGYIAEIYSSKPFFGGVQWHVAAFIVGFGAVYNVLISAPVSGDVWNFAWDELGNHTATLNGTQVATGVDTTYTTGGPGSVGLFLGAVSSPTDAQVSDFQLNGPALMSPTNCPTFATPPPPSNPPTYSMPPSPKNAATFASTVSPKNPPTFASPVSSQCPRTPVGN